MIANAAPSIRLNLRSALKRHQVLFISVVLVGLATGLRFLEINANGFNNDEIFSIWLGAQKPSYVAAYTLFGGKDNVVPPSHYWLTGVLLRLGDQPVVVRMPSLLAGVMMVWLTFRLALELFDLRVATLAGLLIAVAPLQIAMSRVARPHMLASLAALLSLTFFARILFGKGGWKDWAGLVAAAVGAVWLFYTTFLVILFENALVLFLLLRRRLSERMLARWCTSQAVIAIFALPAALTALLGVSGDASTWQSRPGLQALAKSVILLSTGDPSYGPAGITTARILSLLTIFSIGMLGLWLFHQRHVNLLWDRDGPRVLFVLGAGLAPWLSIFAFSLLRPLFRERYFLFVAPPLFILFGWILNRTRNVLLKFTVALSLFGLIGSALYVYYTEPAGEQWREAATYLRLARAPGDAVVVSPGWYVRPFAYYYCGELPHGLEELADAPAVIATGDEFRPVQAGGPGQGRIKPDDQLAEVQRLWLVSGFSPVEAVVKSRIEQDFEPGDNFEFAGVTVRLFERSRE